MRFEEVAQSRNKQIPFLSTATHKLGVASVSGKCRRVGTSLSYDGEDLELNLTSKKE